VLHSEAPRVRNTAGRVTHEPAPEAGLSPHGAGMLWNPATGTFDGPWLRRAIVSRGWTAQEFAAASGVTSASVYSALRGHRVRDRTALKIFRALARRETMALSG